MKTKAFCLLLLLSLILVGCGKKDKGDNTATPGASSPTVAPTQAATTAPTTAPTETPVATTAPQATQAASDTDAVTTASIVNDQEGFLNAIGTNGTWIICLLNDLTIDKEIALEGEFKNGKKDDAGNEIIQRKVALYSQDADRNITARYTLTAPKFTILSPQASIQHGTFKGDLYVGVKDFKLVDTTVDGNVYFMTEEAKSTFTMDETSKVTGKQEMQK
ncbi:hypothetical protein H0486_07030 [Lachnospiraceae bacterium MD1]|uniref:Lipoprotein n=1 Tax=Variimorphobacter saccharofermentans TaxID=2755051 RepID=A0A839JY81_9FIRM|nr:hypothetical protein [Variimorphobacter saccharofermentans]MBB2182625.1 hypothetical protein [Variimorphobacter saccharofermentans]